MPMWLRKLLEADGQIKNANEAPRTSKPLKAKTMENQISGVVEVVQRLLLQDSETEYAYTCHPCVQHVSKLQKEGKESGGLQRSSLRSKLN
jgi:hypothetical protein